MSMRMRVGSSIDRRGLGRRAAAAPVASRRIRRGRHGRRDRSGTGAPTAARRPPPRSAANGSAGALGSVDATGAAPVAIGGPSGVPRPCAGRDGAPCVPWADGGSGATGAAARRTAGGGMRGAHRLPPAGGGPPRRPPGGGRRRDRHGHRGAPG